MKEKDMTTRQFNLAYNRYLELMAEPTIEWNKVLDQFCPSRDADIQAAEELMNAEIAAAEKKFQQFRAARQAKFVSDTAEASAKYEAANDAAWNLAFAAKAVSA